MWISNTAIRKPVVTTVVMLAVVIFGAIALVMLNTDEFPQVEPPVINVAIPYPGAAPRTVERELIDPLEDAFSSISGVKQMNSLAMDGFGDITVQFVFSTDLQRAAQDIRDKISENRNDLPTEMKEPILTRFDPDDLPIVSLTLSSTTRSPADLTRIADPGLTSELRSIPGVADVKVVGGVDRQLTVELKPEALRATGVGVDQVVGALERGNLAVPVGMLRDKFEERTIRLKGRLATPADFDKLVVGGSVGKIVRLGDVAIVRDGAAIPTSAALFNGKPAVGIDIVKTTDASTTAVAARIRNRVRELQKTLPKGVTLNVARDAGVRVAHSVHNVQEELIEGALLTVLVVFVFLMSWRSTVITGLALPVSVLASFVAVWAFGFTLNTMSLLGLSLAIGILIDDAIVVRENIVRHMEMGKDHVTAAREGTSEIGLAVAATTFSIVVVFVPIAFMGGLAQQWFAPFALTIACSVLVSLFVSFSLDPMLSATWSDPEISGERRSWLTRRLERFNRWLDRQTGRYKRVVGWALRHPVWMVLIAIVAFVGALAMPAVGLVGGSFFPKQDRSEFNVEIETPPGSNVKYTLTKAREVARLARKHAEVAYTYSTVGGQDGRSTDEAAVYVRLVPKADRDVSQDQVANELRREIRHLSGATAWVSTSSFGAQKEIQVQLTGPDLTTLNRLAGEMEKEIKQVPGAVDVGLSSKGQKPELEVNVDRDLASSLGLSVGQIAQALRPAFAGIKAGTWVDPTGKTRDVRVRLIPSARKRAAHLEDIPLVLHGPDGTSKVIPLGQVAHVKQGLGPALINHLDRRRVITIGANTMGMPLNAVVAAIQQQIKDVKLPPGYSIKEGGQTKDQRDLFRRILLALGIAVMLMYMILVIQFGSFLDPIPIMASLPMSLIGVMLALWITHTTLNLMSLIGVILLMGIVAKNAILLIDFAKWSHERGVDRKTAIVEAGGVRLRPILMTTFAIVAGMIPVALGRGEGADFRAPLGRAVIGGVITSTLLTLLVIPTFYDILAGWRERMFGWIKRRRRR